MLEQSGFAVDIVTVAGESISAGSVRLETVLKLANVNTDDYAGFIIPCMGVSERKAPEIESVIKKAAEAGKPVAAQLGGVKHLARAGVLKGKKYTYRIEVDLNVFPEFMGAIYGGTGVVRDGNIITSGLCPLLAREEGLEDGTTELTQALIEALKSKQ
jgi:putative intracellular protease/amidase